MSKIVKVLGTVLSEREVTKKINGKLKGTGRYVATVDFGRTLSNGMKALDDVFLPKDKHIEPISYVFSVVFNKAGESISDMDGNPVYVLDKDDKPTDEVRVFVTDSIFAVGFVETD